MQGSSTVRKNGEPELISVKRNPYLVDYEEQRRRGGMQGRSQAVAHGETREGRSRTAAHGGMQGERSRAVGYGAAGKAGSRRPGSRHAAVRARRRLVRLQRLAAVMFGVGVALIAGLLLVEHTVADAAGQGNVSYIERLQTTMQQKTETTVQGLPAETFYAHPEWEEDFLTPNEYSRPGEALEKVTNIFVHYTANPGTSAAQNRSYFEQQKDMHQASVSSHFIIGYDGEILQCLPLDEIGYAVQTRNYDSISIECCYKAEDGSFTQETYDSLIALLAWLTDAYGLETEDILRHYDCGGKKCPLYYTEHPDAWERLKEDVAGYNGGNIV